MKEITQQNNNSLKLLDKDVLTNESKEVTKNFGHPLTSNKRDSINSSPICPKQPSKQGQSSKLDNDITQRDNISPSEPQTHNNEA